MRRRAFGKLLGGTAALSTVWPRRPGAQQPSMPMIGYLDGSGLDGWFNAFRRGLHELGYAEGRTIVIERRGAASQSRRLPELAADLVRLHPSIIVTSGSGPSLAAKAATASIPIVMAFVTDPVGLGLVSNLARPGGNITGLSNMGAGLMGKRLQLLMEIVPDQTRVGVIWSPDTLMNRLDYRELGVAANAIGIGIESFEVNRAEDYDSAFEQARSRVGMVLVLSGTLAFANRSTIVAAAAKHKLPAIYYDAEYAAAGGLVAYGPGLAALHRQAATYVDKILKGARPADLPVQQPTNLEMAINLRAARELGIIIPPSILARANEVIE